MSILQQKQLEQGAGHILKYVQSQQEYMEITLAGMTWDIGKFDVNKDNHTLTIISEAGGIVKEEFENREVEDCFSIVKPHVEQKIKKLLTRLKDGTSEE